MWHTKIHSHQFLFETTNDIIKTDKSFHRLFFSNLDRFVTVDSVVQLWDFVRSIPLHLWTEISLKYCVPFLCCWSFFIWKSIVLEFVGIFSFLLLVKSVSFAQHWGVNIIVCFTIWKKIVFSGLFSRLKTVGWFLQRWIHFQRRIICAFHLHSRDEMNDKLSSLFKWLYHKRRFKWK